MTTDDPIYLDHNATTPILPEVLGAMLPYLRDHFGNPSSGHVYGARARAGVDRARAQVASLLGCDAGEIVFTAGGTESNNLAIRGSLQPLPARRHLVTSCIEHPATARVCDDLERSGGSVSRLPVDARGVVVIDESAFCADTALVTVMHANNETGVVQPIAALSALARRHGALVHTDAAQSLGKVPARVDELGVDLLTLVGHKLYAPKGVGALYVRRGTALAPTTLGAGHERGLRPGTENVASIVGLGEACAIAERTLAGERARLEALRDALFALLSADIPGLVLHGDGAERLPNTLSVRFPLVSGSSLLARADRVAASTGSACHEGHEAASSVITAMGVDPAAALGTVRLSLGRGTTRGDVDQAARCLVAAWRSLVEPR